jgi:hypothetical protein
VNHAEIRSRIADYLEGDLELSQRARFDGHLDGCEPCSREVTELRETVQLLRSLPDPEPPPQLVENVIRRIRGGEGSVRLSDRLRAGMLFLARPQVALPATALAVALVLTSGNRGPWSLPGGVVVPNGLPQAGLQWVSERWASLPFSETTGANSEATGANSETTGANRLPADAPIALQFAGSTVIEDALEEKRRSQVASSQALGFRVAPPAVARAPRITIQIPIGGALPGARPLRVVRHRPASSLPGTSAAFPFSSAGTPRIAPAGGLVVPASRGDATVRQRASLGSLDRVAEREGRKRAELDGRLDKMIQRPVAYSRQFASLTTIEQEIWLRALAEFALETNRAGEAIRGLRSSASPVTLELATAFEAELRRMQAEERPRMAPALESR